MQAAQTAMASSRNSSQTPRSSRRKRRSACHVSSKQSVRTRVGCCFLLNRCCCAVPGFEGRVASWLLEQPDLPRGAKVPADSWAAWLARELGLSPEQLEAIKRQRDEMRKLRAQVGASRLPGSQSECMLLFPDGGDAQDDQGAAQRCHCALCEPRRHSKRRQRQHVGRAN